MSANGADALVYVQTVKLRFSGDKGHVYEAFLAAMKDFKSGRYDTDAVVARIKTLLAGHDDLLDGFNCFLPDAYKYGRHAVQPQKKIAKEKIKREVDEGKDDSAKEEQSKENQPTINGGYNLLKRIRELYNKDDRPYRALLTMLIKFRNKEMTTDEVVKNIGALFFDHPELFEGEDSFEFFISKISTKPKKSQWFDWAPNKHHAFNSPAFRLIVQTFLLCEIRHRRKPPELRNIRLDGHQMDSSDSEYETDGEDSPSDSEEEKEKESGTLRDEQIPECWDEKKSGVRVLNRFEKLTLEQKEQGEDFWWECTRVTREKKAKEAEMRKENKRGREAERLSREAGLSEYDSERELSPPPPEGKARKSKRIVEKIQKGIIYDKYKHLHSPIMSPGRRKNGRMSLLGGMYGSSVPNEIKPKNNVVLKAFRVPELMTKEQKEKVGLHSLPVNCLELILKHYAKIEGAKELVAIRNKLIKNLEKSK